MSNLILHAGALSATREQIAAVETPAATDNWFPVPHSRLIEQTIGQLQAGGLQVVSESHGLSKDGGRYFGVFNLAPSQIDADFNLAVGLRNSHDKSLAAGLALGTRVFVCDNLAFSGEVRIGRKHTRFIERDLPRLMADAVNRVVERGPAMQQRVEAYKNTDVIDAVAHDIVVRSIDSGVIGAPCVPHVLKEWREPKHAEFASRTAWSLFNAFTETLKRYEPHAMAKRSRALYGLFDLASGVSLN